MSYQNRTGPSWNFAPEYQSSGTPFVTSSRDGSIATDTVYTVKFPTVTRWVQIRNTGTGNLKVGFTSNGVQGKGASVSGSAAEQSAENRNYYIIPSASNSDSSTVRWELRCDKLFFQAKDAATSFSLIAGLTNIRPAQFFKLTGSLGFQGVG